MVRFMDFLRGETYSREAYNQAERELREAEQKLTEIKTRIARIESSPHVRLDKTEAQIRLQAAIRETEAARAGVQRLKDMAVEAAEKIDRKYEKLKNNPEDVEKLRQFEEKELEMNKEDKMKEVRQNAPPDEPET